MNELTSQLFELFGETIELVGGLYLLNKYFNRTKFKQLLFAIIRSPFNEKSVSGISFIVDQAKEKPLHTLRGIFLILFGFLIKMIPHVFIVSVLIFKYMNE